MNNPNLPTYIGTSKIAHELRYRPYNVVVWIKKWGNDPDLPTPAPDAYFQRSGENVMLWLEERLPEWREWNRQRIALSRTRRTAAGNRAGRPPRFGNQPKA